MHVEALDFRGAVALRDRIGAGARAARRAGAAVGVVLRERVA